jgi:hypothetical protein
MATPTIPNGEEYFFPIIYEGNGAGQRVGKFVPFTDNGTIDNSCLFENNVSSYLSRTLSSNGSGTTVTFSCWVKRDILAQGLIGSVIMMHSNISSNSEILSFDSSDRLHYYEVTSGSRKWNYISNRTFEDTSKWYHILVSRDTTNATQADRVKIYVDGERITSWNTETQPALNATGYWNQTTYDAVVGNTNSGSYIDGAGYLSEVNMIDGTALGPSTFGVTDTSTGRWIPKALSGITYGTNGFRLKFQDSSALGDDTSGNGNDLTATNLASTDQTTDSPTQNHATLSPHSLYKSSNFTLSEGNLKATSTSTAGTHSGQGGMRIPNGGKYYWECEIDAGKDGMGIGIIPADTPTTSANPSTATLYLSNGSMRTDGSNAISYGSGVSNGDIMGFALDLSNPANGKLYVSVNGTYENNGNPVTGANPAPANPLIGDFRVIYQDGSNGYTPVYIYNFGQKSFNTSAPTGFVALQQDNLPETAKGISGLVWTKNRDATDNHQWYDSSRGNTAVITSGGTPAETTVIDGLQKFLAGGQQIEDNDAINTAGESFVSWNWVGNGATEVTNTEGSVTTTVQANTTAGFSILKFTPPSSGITDQTFGHGLTKAPEWFLFKRRDNVSTGRFLCFHKSAYDASNGGYSMEISSTNANTAFNTELGASAAYPAAPTATTISIKNNSVIAGGKNHIAYCWHSVEGFSKFGSYTGNGSTDGTFVYTGFRPAWVMYKNITTASQWVIMDTKRSAFNPVGLNLLANATSVEDDGGTSQRKMDILSNGFKLRVGNYTDTNKSANTYIYMAFALHPFVGDGTSPVTAR